MLMIISTLRVGPSRARSFLLLKQARSRLILNFLTLDNSDRRSRMKMCARADIRIADIQFSVCNRDHAVTYGKPGRSFAR